ncbi:hypothetical protein CERSUDRAFT_162619 [Gelatoporia subvermispora B]|uniref:Guanine nucleotide exchange factor n=1 Tax=Ceriporiopsis subvermispora (strain B) TaxID=914234 RepID=M2P8T0_CERS8|nr:hypothetical protein CERSUDRAFT_162619 [Gelatoporia subvermispora B]
MSKLLENYAALSATSPRAQVSSVLQSILTRDAVLPFQIDDASRKELIQSLLDDLAKCTNKATQALQAVKSLGKTPAGSEVIATSANLSSLLDLSSAFKEKDTMDASNEALRCIANALLLVGDARQTFVQKEVGGADFAVDLLEKSTAPERLFLASRLLFLSTVSISASGDFIRSLVEAKPPGHSGNVIEIIGSKLDLLSRSIQGSMKLAREAMTDLLKFTFNLLLHYPKIVDESEGTPLKAGGDPVKVIGDSWHERLDGILPPLLRIFNTLPPTFPSPLTPPMTHVIHTLITIPVTPSLQSKWFPPSSNRTSPRPSSSKSNRDSPVSFSESGKPASTSSSQSNSPTGTSKPPGAFDRAMSALAAGRRSLSRSSSPHPGSSVDVLLRTYDLLEVTLAHYLPGTIDPDDPSVRERVRQDGEGSLDDAVVPLVVLITKFCIADESSRLRMRQWLLPDDLDRTSPLEGRSDLLGRCLRLMACVHHQRLKPAVGELLYAICDSDASTLAGYVGYGNVAGFLFHKGITGAPPRPTGNSLIPSTTPTGAPINPITGIVEQPNEGPEMSDEEKEREAEKLFVLFDRLEKSGAIPPSQNPIRKAVQEGRLG